MVFLIQEIVFKKIHLKESVCLEYITTHHFMFYGQDLSSKDFVL